eukprot:TRINITY_DN15854_c0_g1_i1.p1 TRINITY_DN15854_c0_g1~~TRINITY_DN15854_c0_g1_i1.p1  ORF type:complete len:169 (-),score=21.35 TRINITY_DN15854_c0_g1_i1:142-648(-)
MIKAILIINNHGKPRLTKFYELNGDETKQQEAIREIFKLLAKRGEHMCNFLEGDRQWGKDTKIVYRQYATLYFVFWVDSSESELGILDLIQVFVETLDNCFENVCELDIIFNMEKVHYILDEIVMGGMVLETEMPSILKSYNEQVELVKSENRLQAGLDNVLTKIKKR